MKKTNVLILLHGLGANGIDSLYAKLSNQWSDNVNITYFLAVDPNAKQFWEDSISQTNVRIIKLHDLDKGRLKRWPRTLYKALKVYGPFDVIHSNMDMLNGINMIIAKFCGIEVRISHAHRGLSEKSPNTVKNAISGCYRSIMKMLMSKFSTKKLACSDVAGDYFFGKGKYSLLFNGIDLSEYRSTPLAPINNLSDKINVERTTSDSPIFCAVGRFAAPKNPFKILGVFKAIHNRIPAATLIWCGGGELFNQVKKQADIDGLSGAINFVGVTKYVASYLKEADYFLMPSLFEGLSLALAEAQAAGLVCFASDTCSKLSDCGRICFIPLQASDEQWADVICNYVTNPGEFQLNHESMRRFDIASMAQTLEKYYNPQQKDKARSL